MCSGLRIRAGSLVAVLLTLTAALRPSTCTRRTLTRRHGFFDVLSDAFANDETVSKLDYGDNAPAAAAQPPGSFKLRGIGATVNEAVEKGADGGEGSSRGMQRKKRKQRTDPRTVIVALSLLSCLATMILLYSRLSPLESTPTP